MNAEQLIESNLKSYQSLRRELGEDDPRVIRSLGTLRDLIIVEIYFMKSLRIILEDEEMSGFVLFVDGDIQGLLDGYRQSKGPFMPYLKESMERRAKSYLREKMRKFAIQRTCFEFTSTYTMTVAETSPEDHLCHREDVRESRQERSSAIGMLRYACQRNPSRVRKLFVFLCTLMPFLSVDVIDRFCIALNCDREQTAAISRCIEGIRESLDKRRTSKAYMGRMINLHWAKILENDGLSRFSLNPEVPKVKADFHRLKLSEAIKGSRRAKMNVPYKIIGDLMNIGASTVSLYVMHSKLILQRILKAAQTKVNGKFRKAEDVKLPRFEPFREFNMRTMDKSA